MSKQGLIDVLNKTSEIEKLLTPSGGSFMPNIKTINGKVEFQIWKAELKHQIQKLKHEPLIVEILQLLDNGFKNGFTDEKDFVALKSKLSVVSVHIDEYFDNQSESEVMLKTAKLKKGTKINTAFDEYILIEQVGSGGNGRVFSAKNVNNDLVAVKFVERCISVDKLKRFKNEIHFCEHHKHKNIIRIIDRGYVFLDDKDYVFYVMPLMAENLRRKINQGISHNEIVNIFIGILEGLKYAHQHKAVHRDIKPENILFAEDSFEPVICDFGIAHFAEEDLLTVIETKAGERMANFSYAAPEQRNRGAQIKPQTDIYAAALILNEMFTGEIPLAAGHKTIAYANKDYKYLDELFNQLYKQEPDERLYPEDKIITELKLLAEIHNREQEKIVLQSKIDKMIVPENFDVRVISLVYKNEKLSFLFDKIIPDEWYQILIGGMYDHSSLGFYDCNKMQKYDDKTLYMKVRSNERKDTIKNIVDCVNDWVKKTNSIYSLELEKKARYEQCEKEHTRIEQIKRIEQESEINKILSDILK